MTNLTPNQLLELKKNFCLEVVDNMDMNTLLEIVFDQLFDSYDNFDQEEMKEEIVTYYCNDEQHYNNMVNEINPYTDSNPEALTDYGVGK